jgi:hypothetical protein
MNNESITLRDYFAAAALTGLIASGKHGVYNAVEVAYDAADKMIEIREKKEE